MPDDDLSLDPIPKIDKRIQVVIVCWIEGKGWLATRRGLVYGGRHGEPPTIDMSLGEMHPIVHQQVDNGLRAMKHRYEEALDADDRATAPR